MRVVVLTVDQRGSTKLAATDRVPATCWLAGLDGGHPAASVRAHRRRRVPGRARRPRRAGPGASSGCCARTPGTSASASATVEEPLPESTRAGRGAAYLHARDAVTAAKSSPWRLRVEGDDPGGPAARDHPVALGRRAGPAHRRGAGRSPTSSTPGLRYDDAGPAPRHHPVRRQPARAGGRHRRGPARPRAGHRPRRRTCSGRGAPHERRRPPPSSSWCCMAFGLVAAAVGLDAPLGRTDLGPVSPCSCSLAGGVVAAVVRAEVDTGDATAIARGRPGGVARGRSAAARSRPWIFAARRPQPRRTDPDPTRSRPRGARAPRRAWIGALERAAVFARPGRRLARGSSPSSWPSRASAATPSSAPPGRRTHRRRRALHHRHLHQRALGVRVCRHRRAAPVGQAGCRRRAQRDRPAPGRVTTSETAA